MDKRERCFCQGKVTLVTNNLGIQSHTFEIVLKLSVLVFIFLKSDCRFALSKHRSTISNIDFNYIHLEIRKENMNTSISGE